MELGGAVSSLELLLFVVEEAEARSGMAVRGLARRRRQGLPAVSKAKQGSSNMAAAAATAGSCGRGRRRLWAAGRVHDQGRRRHEALVLGDDVGCCCCSWVLVGEELGPAGASGAMVTGTCGSSLFQRGKAERERLAEAGGAGEEGKAVGTALICWVRRRRGWPNGGGDAGLWESTCSGEDRGGLRGWG